MVEEYYRACLPLFAMWYYNMIIKYLLDVLTHE